MSYEINLDDILDTLVVDEEATIDQETSFEGRILVDINHGSNGLFKKSIVYIFEHDEEGALGVILNHHTGYNWLAGHKIKDDPIMANLKALQKPLLCGGPVRDKQVTILALSPQQKQEFAEEKCLTIYTGLQEFIDDFQSSNVSDKYIVLRGLAVWGPNQLEQEVASNSWLITEATIDLLFASDIKDKWVQAITNIGIKEIDRMVPYSGNA